MRAGSMAGLLSVVLLLAAGGCVGEGPDLEKSPETMAVEETAGDFLDFYEEVLRLARHHAADPDSFRISLDGLPGSHLTDEEWEAWTAPYEEEPAHLAARIEEVLTDLASGRK